jgi:preprotein translocase subunit SecB
MQPELSAPLFNIQRVYLKGASLEMPHAPASFLEQAELTINLEVTPKMVNIAPDLYEINLHATLEAKNAKTGATNFLLEIDQAGIFELRNIPAEHMADLLDVRCPSILHGYLRVQMSDMLARATLPGFLLPEFDWMAMALQRRAETAVPRVMH